MRTAEPSNKGLLTGVLVVAALLFILFLFFAGIVHLIARLESQVSAAIVAASVTALGSIAVIIAGKHFEHKLRLQQELRERKAKAYEELLGMIFDTLFAKPTGKKPLSTKELQTRFASLTPKLIVWGSQDVIKAWNSVRHHDWEGAQSVAGFLTMEQLLRAMRQDLGEKVNLLRPGEMMQLFINLSADQQDLFEDQPKQA